MPRKKGSLNKKAVKEGLPNKVIAQTPKKVEATEKRDWYFFDASKEVLGRLSTTIAQVLMGKKKPHFARNKDVGDYAVVVNSDLLKVTGNKELLKLYYRHSGYPGGFQKRTLEQKRNKDSREIIINSVKGMLPDNKLKPLMLKRLYIFKDSNNPYADKIKI